MLKLYLFLFLYLLLFRKSLDSFSDLVAGSIDYAESTSHQLQPSRTGPLNLDLLKSIKEMVEDIKERQFWKASGIASHEQYRQFP